MLTLREEVHGGGREGGRGGGGGGGGGEGGRVCMLFTWYVRLYQYLHIALLYAPHTH